MAEHFAKDPRNNNNDSGFCFGQPYPYSLEAASGYCSPRLPPPYPDFSQQFQQPSHYEMTRTQSRSEIRACASKTSVPEPRISCSSSSSTNSNSTTISHIAAMNPQSKRARRQRRRKSSQSEVPENNKGRTLMRDWLREQVDSGEIEGLRWEDAERTIVRIPWRHASRHGWELDNDACLFMRWAKHTGKYEAGCEVTSAKKWKANFRCALNSLPGMRELTDQTRKTGPDAFKIYQFVSNRKGRVAIPKPQEAVSRPTEVTPTMSYATRSKARSTSQMPFQTVVKDEEKDLNANLHIDISDTCSPPYVLPSSSARPIQTNPAYKFKGSVLDSSSLQDSVDHSYALTPAPATPVIPTVVESSEQNFHGTSNDLTPLYASPSSPSSSSSDDGSHTDSGYEDDVLMADLQVIAGPEIGANLSVQDVFKVLLDAAPASEDMALLSDAFQSIQRDLTKGAPVVTQPILGAHDLNAIPMAWNEV